MKNILIISSKKYTKLKNYTDFVSLIKSKKLEFHILFVEDVEQYDNYLKKDNSNFNEGVVFSYVEHLSKDRAFSWRSQSRVISSIKAFCKYLLLKNIVDDNFAKDLVFTKKGRDLPKAITHSILQRVIDDKDQDKPNESLARTILIVFYATGLRISELIKLTISDLEDNQGKAIRVKGKG